MSQRICIGVDNGHYAHKVCDHTGKMSSILTRARRGENNTLSMMGGASKSTTIITDGVPYSVSDNLRSYEPVNPMTFPTSQMARILLHNALLNHEGGKYRDTLNLHVCTGLPLGRYFINGTSKRDDKLVSDVENNLSQPVIVKITDPSGKLFESEVSLKVIAKPQTFVAWYAYVLEEVRNGSDPSRPDLVQHEDRKDQPIAIVDIGGGTTEICVIENRELDCSVSGSKIVGSNNIREMLSKLICEKFSMDSITTYNLDRAMSERRCIEIDGNTHDVSALYQTSLNIASEEIISFIDDKIGKRQRELNAVRLIGGGCSEFTKAIQRSVNRSEVAPLPQFENAKGMYLMQRYLLR